MVIGDLDPLVPGDSDLLSEGPGHIREIKETLVDTFGDFPIGLVYADFLKKQSLVANSIKTFGTPLSVGSGVTKICAMKGNAHKDSDVWPANALRILRMDTTADTITAYIFDTVTHVFSVDAATPLSIAGAGYGAVARLDNHYFAVAAEAIGIFIGEADYGTALTQVALTLNAVSLTNPSCARCGSFTGGSTFNLAVLGVGASPTLKMYSSNGANALAQVGNTYSFATTTYSAISYMGAVPNTAPQRHRFVIGYGPINGSRMRIVEWDGTDFTNVSPEFIGPSGGEIDVEALSLTDFIFVNTNNGLRHYRFDGTSISQVGKVTASLGSTGSQPNLTSVNATTLFHHDSDTGMLRAMHIDYVPSHLILTTPPMV